LFSKQYNQIHNRKDVLNYDRGINISETKAGRPSGTEEGFIGRQVPQWAVAFEEEEDVVEEEEKKKNT
jgi:hypothetical protein